MVQKLMMLWRDEEAPTAVEYGILVSLIGAVIIGVVTTLGTNLTSLFNYVGSKVTTP